jgi:hypothetical protein
MNRHLVGSILDWLISKKSSPLKPLGQRNSDKVYQLPAHGRWFSPASSTTKTGRHDIAEILLKVALKHQKYLTRGS